MREDTSPIRVDGTGLYAICKKEAFDYQNILQWIKSFTEILHSAEINAARAGCGPIETHIVTRHWV